MHHFRGSVNLLLAAKRSGVAGPTYDHLLQLITKQAVRHHDFPIANLSRTAGKLPCCHVETDTAQLCVSLRTDVPFCLPHDIRTSLALKTDLKSRTTTVASHVADICASIRQESLRTEPNFGQRSVLSDWCSSIVKSLDAREAELRDSLPYRSDIASVDSYPAWYQPISTHVGGPKTVHRYYGLRAASTWNTYRMARIKLYSGLIASGTSLNPLQSLVSDDEPQRSHPGRNSEHMTTNALGLIEDLCASVSYCLLHKSDGRPVATTFSDIYGARAYALISPLAVATECVQSIQKSNGYAAVGTLEWMQNVLIVMREKFGISEAWCWKDGHDEEARVQIERELHFDA